MQIFGNILYPVALTDISPNVVPYVVAMAKKFEASVHLLHVLRRFDWFVDTYVRESTEPDFKRIATDFESKIHKQTEKKLTDFVEHHMRDVTITQTAVVTGTHYKEILNYVETEGIDLIIMGTGSGLQKAIFGSVAERVSRLADVPVMLIKNAQ